MADEAQRRAKARIVRDAFQRIAKREIPTPEIRHGPSSWRYRVKLTLALRRARDGWVAGLHRYDNAAAVFPVADCEITDERVMRAWRLVLERSDLFPRARRLRASVKLVRDATADVALTVEGGVDWDAAPKLLEAVADLVEIWWQPREGARRLVAARDGKAEPAAGGGSFAQVNTEVARLVREHVVGLTRSRSPLRVIDAYSGTGDLAETLAHSGGGIAVTAIERDPTASRVSAARLPAGSRSVTALVEEALPNALPADVVLLNPPRAGVHPAVTRALTEARPRPGAIIYTSCDPSTLARDVGRLPGYQVASVVGFDMFPHTAHVETVCELVAL